MPSTFEITSPLNYLVDRADVDEARIGAIRNVLAPYDPFNFQLTSIDSFGDLKYLAPEPSEPFIALTESFSVAFPQWPPYENAFNKIIPHLSIGDSLSAAEVSAVEERFPLST